MTRRHVSKRHLQKNIFCLCLFAFCQPFETQQCDQMGILFVQCLLICTTMKNYPTATSCHMQIKDFYNLVALSQTVPKIWSHWVLYTIREFLRSIRCRTESLFYCCSIVSNSSLGQWWWSSGQRARHLLRRSEFESCWSIQFYSVNCFKRTKINKKRPGIAHF